MDFFQTRPRPFSIPFVFLFLSLLITRSHTKPNQVYTVDEMCQRPTYLCLVLISTVNGRWTILNCLIPTKKDSYIPIDVYNLEFTRQHWNKLLILLCITINQHFFFTHLFCKAIFMQKYFRLIELVRNNSQWIIPFS